MSSLNCGQCNQPISCNNGNIDNLKKHIKSEHEVVKYKLELNLAMALLTEKEGEEMVRRIKDRLDGFQETGILDISKNSIYWDMFDTLGINNITVSLHSVCKLAD